MSICAMVMSVKVVRPVLLDVFAEGGHLKVHASVNVSVNGRVHRRVRGCDSVNEQHRCESILSGSVEESVGARDFAPSVRFDE